MPTMPTKSKALKLQHSNQVISKLNRAGIYIRAKGKRTVAEEAPEAYKDVNAVVGICDGAGIAKLVAKMRPVGVMKG